MYKASFGLPIKKKKKKKAYQFVSTKLHGTRWIPRHNSFIIPTQDSRFTIHVRGSRFTVQGSGFRVQGSTFGVRRSAFNVQRSAFSVHDTRYTIHDSGIAEADRCSWRSTKFFLRKIKRCKSVQKWKKKINNRNAMKIVQSRETFVRTSLYARAESELKPFGNRVSRHLRTNLTSLSNDCKYTIKREVD